VPARVPLDIDIEDRIVYGLTPTRLAYAALALLAAMTLWSDHGFTAVARIPICVTVLAAGACLAWGRFQGRGADAWLVDIALFVWRTRQVKWHGG
jgi:hypothetical protein